MSKPKSRPEAWLAALALTIICLISLGNVVVRYTTNASFAFTEEFSVFLLVVLTFSGAAVAARQHDHIRIIALEEYLPHKLKRPLYLLQWLLSVLLLGLIVWYGGLLTYEEYTWESLSPGLGYPTWIYLIWLPLLSLAIIIRLTQSLIERWKQSLTAERSDV
ncbi:TRAP transporter small permease [Nitrincola iocasae]|jgi:TRAP-type C4-dicarboxylate transport system permease small subunit|uniref:TRAP transporter small permease protein n=1 Tax=Nitrincola iocasae TaxID=2614693 RepID=A0A5J6LCY6_9GAMM|nr:TRAP transporter small permease [Nitrincola iocasae]QEW06380.1 TRAP transporter small permease [Nitrincola iocasae]